ncbi:MAG: hypothetical protein AAFO63_14450 [Pseudomonadota bacterium]
MTDGNDDKRDAQTAAIALMRQYGEDAGVIATLRAAEVAAAGDVAALAHWDAVISYLEHGPDESQRN